MFGTDGSMKIAEMHIPMTRDEYIDRWLMPTRSMVGLFSNISKQSELIDFQLKLIEAAGIEWDRMHKQSQQDLKNAI